MRLAQNADERSMTILAAIVDEYIRTGLPIGSKALAERGDIDVSSATIRSICASLEQEGFLCHPHTSAGRVPTYKGFRYYIEHLMSPIPLEEERIKEIDDLFDGGAMSDDAIVANASAALAEITKCTTFSANHAAKFSVITKVDLIPTGKRLYVLLLIASNGAIKNKVCRMEFDLTHEQMEGFTSFLNERLRGVNLENMSEEYIEKLTEALGGYMLALSPLVHAVYELSEEFMRDSVEVKGEANLIASGEFHAEDVARFIERKAELSAMLSDVFSGINVKFGEESDTFAISNSALLSASYYKDGKPAGTIGLIGPVRLDYRKVIPYIEYLSRKVTTLLSDGGDPIQTENEGDDDDVE